LDKIRNTYITEQRRRNKMSQVIDNLCEDRVATTENGQILRLFHLPVSGKRPRDKEESENGPVKTAKGSAKFVVDLLADEVDISPHGKRLVVATEIGVDVGNSEETSRYDGSANIIPETIDIETT
jgi:hypothetical protein